ncbi:MAG: glycosyltransferase [Desulfomonilaceae bacterium]
MTHSIEYLHVASIAAFSLAVPAYILLYAGLIKVWIAFRKRDVSENSLHTPPIEIIVPVKGANADQKNALQTLLEQEYPSYTVTLVVESEDDLASSAIDQLCTEYQHARKLIAGIAAGCGQKNHNLVYALSNLKPETEIVVFCDSTNAAPPEWLRRFTRPLRSGESEVVTTFRRFFPRPQNIAGVTQTMYGVAVLLLASVAPKPWGGGTGIRRAILETLPIRDVWSKTVVDDLVLGNLLARAGVKVSMDPKNLLISPLRNHSFRSLLGYLDRQIMFPKFTNHEMWGTLLVLYVNLAIAVPLALWEGARFFLAHESGNALQYAGLGLVGGMMILMLLARKLVTPHIAVAAWLLSLFPLLFSGAFIFLHSIFRGFIDWHGRRYWCSRDGLVTRVEDLPE